MNFRKSTPKDVSFILEMITELATFEKAPEQVTVTEEELLKDGFGESPLYISFIIEEDKEKIGFILYYNRYSTWKGKSLYLEDLYIKPRYRGRGFGKTAMNFLYQEAKRTNCKRFEWQVLDWNKPAIELYKSMGATLDGEWINCRIEDFNPSQLG